jgi:membrane protease YdiL (CAAX protease family)
MRSCWPSRTPGLGPIDVITAEPLPLPRLLVLHLVPGALATVVFVLLAGPVEAAGFPPLAAFLVAILLVIIPFELGVVLRASRREAPQGGWLASVAYRGPMRARDWLVLLPVVLVAAILGFGVLSLIEQPILDALFSWLPEWFVKPLPVDSVDQYSASAWAVTLIGYAALNVIAGPVTEELYFRGYLLPRMSQFGRWAPLLNVVLFSLYHFWSPWQFLSRIAGVTPFAYAVWWKRNVFLGMAVHIALNGIGTATVIALILQRLN